MAVEAGRPEWAHQIAERQRHAKPSSIVREGVFDNRCPVRKAATRPAEAQYFAVGDADCAFISVMIEKRREKVASEDSGEIRRQEMPDEHQVNRRYGHLL